MTEATLQERTDVNDVVRYSKHCGWCTKGEGTARSYLSRGRLFTIKKAGKRRPSVQIYVSNSSYEIKSKGNQNETLNDLQATYPNLADEVTQLLQPAIDSSKNPFDDLGVPAQHAADGFRQLGNAFNEALERIEAIELVDVLSVNMDVDTDFGREHDLIHGNHTYFRRGCRTANIEVIRSENPALHQYRLGDQIALSYREHRFAGVVSQMVCSVYGGGDDILSLSVVLN